MRTSCCIMALCKPPPHSTDKRLPAMNRHIPLVRHIGVHIGVHISANLVLSSCLALHVSA